MKKIRYILLFAVVLAITTLSSCSKDENDKIVGSWKRVKVEEKKPTGDWKNVTQNCHIDDIEEYTSAGKWTFYDGTDQCNAGSGILSGTWRLAAENTKVIYTYSGYAGDYESTIETLNDNTMVLTNAVGDVNNTQQRITYAKN